MEGDVALVAWFGRAATLTLTQLQIFYRPRRVRPQVHVGVTPLEQDLERHDHAILLLAREARRAVRISCEVAESGGRVGVHVTRDRVAAEQLNEERRRARLDDELNVAQEYQVAQETERVADHVHLVAEGRERAIGTFGPIHGPLVRTLRAHTSGLLSSSQQNDTIVLIAAASNREETRVSPA